MALIVADSLILLLFGHELVGLRHSAWVPSALRDALDVLLPLGARLAAEITMAVLLCLLVMKAYALAGRGPSDGRRVTAVALGAAIPSWPALWQGEGRAVAGYLVLTSTLALFLILEGWLVESLIRLGTPKRSGGARVLLLAGRHDTRRVRRHAFLSDQTAFAVQAIFDPKGLRSHRALEELCDAIRSCQADTILLCCGGLCDRAFAIVLDAATTTGCELVSLARSCRGAGSEPRLLWSRGSPLIVLTSPAGRAAQLVAKRAVDVVGACVGLVVLAPLLVIIALAVRLQSPGPILFGHRRVGVGGRPFRCLKFRSMRIDAEELLRSDPVLLSRYVQNNFKLPEDSDPRITRLGRLLRATSLDELPQLWNVLRGEMSLVGPRPVVQDELAEYGDQTRLLLSLRPGLAGAWAVNGRSRVGYPHRANIEVGYVRSWRFLTDLRIMVRAIPVVLTRRGAH